MTVEKNCPRCNTVKSANEFYKRQEGGLRSHCKACTSKQHRAYNVKYNWKSTPRGTVSEEVLKELTQYSS